MHEVESSPSTRKVACDLRVSATQDARTDVLRTYLAGRSITNVILAAGVS